MVQCSQRKSSREFWESLSFHDEGASSSSSPVCPVRHGSVIPEVLTTLVFMEMKNTC